MVRFIKGCLLVTAACVMAFSAVGGIKFGIEWKSDGTFVYTGKEGVVRGKFTCRDGESGKLIPLRGSGKNGTYTFQGDGIVITLKDTPVERLTRLDCLVDNRSKRERRLEPALTLYVKRSVNDRYYEGFNVLDAEDAPLSRVGIKGKPSKHIGGGLNPPFPVSAIFDKARVVFAGQLVDDWTSHNSSFYRPRGKQAEITFAQRLVPGAGQKLDFRFVIGAFHIRFGAEENIIQSYYDAFPERFRSVAHPDNWLLRGAHSHYRAYIGKPDVERERRYYASIEWAYAPFKRSGDPWGHDDLWNYKALVKPSRTVEFNMRVNGSVLNYNKMSAAKYRAARKAIFDKWGERLGYAYYSCPGWCEITLAQSRYADAINNDTVGGVKRVINGWVVEHDREIRVLPLSTTSVGVAARRDLARLAKELKLNAFTLDCGAAGIYYRGPAAADPASKGRAWDEKGLFIDELVAANEIIDFVHGLRPDNPIVVWKNGPGRGDMKMIEASIFHPLFRSWMPQTRYNTGMRPTVIHARVGYMVNDNIPNWRQLDREAFYREFSKLGDHAVLTGFRYGVTQSDRTCNGNPQLLYCMPELLEVIKLGWQPVFPVKYDSKGKFLYRARYGIGTESVLFLGNPWQKPMPLEMRVDNRELKGSGAHLFVRKMRDKAATVNQVNGVETIFSDALPVRRPALYEAVCALDGCPDGFTAAIRAEKDLNKIVYTISVTGGRSFETVIRPRRIDNFAPGQVLLNGKAVSGKVTISEKSKIEIVYNSKVFLATKKEILSFPFTNSRNLPRFAVVLPPDARDYERREADAIAGYFRFTYAHKITGKPSTPRVHKRPAGHAVVIERGAPVGISREGDYLVLRANTMEELRKLREKLSFVMDERYPWIFPFTPSSDLPREVFNKFDMGKRPLPWSRCFEAEAAKK